MGLKHLYRSPKADPVDATIIGATKWNDDHYYVDAAGAPVGNVGALLLAGAAGALTHLNSVAAGSVLTSAGVGALPVWAAGASVPAALVANSLTFSIANPDVVLSRSAANTLLLAGEAVRLQFGGTTSAYPALKRNLSFFDVKLADDSNYADFRALNVLVNGQRIYMDWTTQLRIEAGMGSPEGVVACAVGSLWLRQDGAAGTTLYVKQTGGTGTTGWVAK